MGLREQECPRCGAPMAAQEAGVVYCGYCKTPLVPSRDGFSVLEAYRNEDLVHPEQRRFWLAGRRYRVLGGLASGEVSDVFVATRDHRLTERVIAKVLRSHDDRSRFEQEWDTLKELQRSTAQGASHFSRLLPNPVAIGKARLGTVGHEGEREVALYGFPSGFVHSMDDVRAHHQDGVDPSAAVWMFKRLLELLSFVHASGYVHGAVLPRHALVHARDHGVRLCGFALSGRRGQPLSAYLPSDKAFYPAEALDHAVLTCGLDVVMAARLVLWLLGGRADRAPSSCPAELARVLERTAELPFAKVSQLLPGDTWSLRDEVASVAEQIFGPPKFVPFSMPGWGP